MMPCVHHFFAPAKNVVSLACFCLRLFKSDAAVFSGEDCVPVGGDALVGVTSTTPSESDEDEDEEDDESDRLAADGLAAGVAERTGGGGLASVCAAAA